MYSTLYPVLYTVPCSLSCTLYHGVGTEWQWSHPGVFSIMMEKFAPPGERGGCTPIPCHYSYHHVQSCMQCTLQLRVQIHSPYSSLPLCTVCPVLYNVPYILLCTIPNSSLYPVLCTVCCTKSPGCTQYAQRWKKPQSKKQQILIPVSLLLSKVTHLLDWLGLELVVGKVFCFPVE